MRVHNLDRGWGFGPGRTDAFVRLQGTDKDRIVDLPHDYMIENEVSADAPAGSASGFYNAGVAHYRKSVFIPKEWEQDRVWIRFDGVMMNATLDVNGGRAALHHYGYTPFCVDITPYLFFGQENSLVVIVNPTMQPNSRWYSGAGIFRSVELIHVPMVHVACDGIYGVTERIVYGEGKEAQTALIRVRVKVENNTVQDHMAAVEVSLIDDRTGECALSRRTRIQVDAGCKQDAYLTLTVDRPKLWSAETPALYRLEARVTDLGLYKTHFVESAEKTVDTDSVLFGIRTVTADVKNGLLVNEKSVKLKGGCVHHDNGLLGAASFYDAEVRRISKMKEVGFNAIRTTHNPPSRVLLEVCDRLGMYVFAEAFDAWGMAKQPGDYNQYFDTDWEKDLEAFVRRDRNHPSILLWSTGNEISERGGLNHGYTLAAKLAEKIKSLDGRPVSNGICSFWCGLDDETAEKYLQGASSQQQNDDKGSEDLTWETLTEPFTNGLDIVGYNYMEDRYPQDHEMFPERIILGSENFPKEIGKRWPMVERTPYVIGDFTWTAVDYIGEAGIGKSFFLDPKEGLDKGAISPHITHFPYRLADDADIDINGTILPQGHYRSVVFGSEETRLFSYAPSEFGKEQYISRWGFTPCQRSWTYPGQEGRPVSAVVFSRAQEVALYVNGRLLGKKKQGEAMAAEELPLSFVFDLTYEPGELTAVSYTDGQEVSWDRMVTAGEPCCLRLVSDRPKLTADGHGLAYVEVEVTDSQGRLVPDAEFLLTACAKGAAHLAGFGSAAPITTENYTAGAFTTYRGRCCAILRSGYEAGQATLTVTSPELGSAQLTLAVE